LVSKVSDFNSDDALIARGASGDREALRLLVERWQGSVFAFAMRMIGSQEESQDLTQEVFVRVCQNAHRYRPTGQFRSWLFRIAGNVVRSQLRRKRILRWVRLDSGIHDRPSPSKAVEKELEEQERKLAVRSAILGLPARQRQAVALRYYENMTYQDVALAMGTSVSAVESLLHRAIAGLRQHLFMKEAGK